jgi:hypothetical protein
LFRDIKENPEGEKETWGMGREIFIKQFKGILCSGGVRLGVGVCNTFFLSSFGVHNFV